MTAQPPSRIARLRPARPAEDGSGPAGATAGTGEYSDTLALNDIHAILTTPAPQPPAGALQDITAVLARAGRLLFPARMITASVADDPRGLPVARIDAEGTTITISQRPNAPGLQLAITPRDKADEDNLVVAIAGKVIRHARPRPAAPQSAP